MTVVWMVILVGLPLCRWLANKNRRLRTQLEDAKAFILSNGFEIFLPGRRIFPKSP